MRIGQLTNEPSAKEVSRNKKLKRTSSEDEDRFIRVDGAADQASSEDGEDTG